jgi:hypothetical protein
MALGTPVGIGSSALTAQTAATSPLVTSTTVPSNSTVVVVAGASVSGNLPTRVADDSGLGLKWRGIRYVGVGGAVVANLSMYWAYAPKGLPSGTTLTFSFASVTSSTRLLAAAYIPGFAVPERNKVAANSVAGTSWTSGATATLTAASQVGIAAAIATDDTTSTPGAGSELYDFNAAGASGDRTLVMQYETGLSASGTYTGAGTWAVSVAGSAVIAATFKEYTPSTLWATEVAADSPVNWWHLDESAGTSAVDDPGTSNGTYVNTPTLAQDGALDESVNSVGLTAAQSEDITLPITLGTGAFTLEFWAKATSLTNVLVRDHSGSGGTVIPLVSSPQSSVRLAGSTIGAAPDQQFPTAWMIDGQWHHYALVRTTGPVGFFYIDGQLQSTGSAATTNTASPLHCGRNGSNANYETVSFDEVAYYTTALSHDRILAHFNAAVSERIIVIEGQGVASAEAFGNPTVAAVQALAILAIDSAEAFGTPTVTINRHEPSAITSEEAFGNPTVTVGSGTQTVEPTAIASLEAFGSPSVATTQSLAPLAINSAEAFGSPTLVQGAITVAILGIASAEEVRFPLVTRPQTIAPLAINSAEAFGLLRLRLLKTVTIQDLAIPSAEAFGLPTLSPRILPLGIQSQEAPGFPVWIPGPIYRDILGIESEESFTTELRLHYRVYILAKDSEEAVGFPEGIGHVLEPSPQPGALISRRSRRGYVTQDRDGKAYS